MAIQASFSSFTLALVGDGISSVIVVDLEKTPFNFSDTRAFYFTRVQLPIGVIQASANGTVGGVGTTGTPTVSVVGANMSITLPFVADAGSFIGLTGRF